MALVVLDSSVVIAFLDPEDSLHDAAVTAVRSHQHDELAIPASAYAEILVAPYRSGGEAVAGVEAFLSDFGVRVQPITPEIARTAARLRSSSRVRLPDALVLATGDELAADRVLTGDDAWARLSGRVALVHRPER